jgi:WD40 repeat protein
MPQAATATLVNLKMVGSNIYGRYPKISNEQTFNMFISDNWLVPFAGYNKEREIAEGVGRALFSSSRYGRMIAVIGNEVRVINDNLDSVLIGTLETSSGDVFIDENDAKQIAICDKKNIHIFDYTTDTFSKAVLDFTPAYIAFQDGYFIAPETGEPKWRLSALNNGLSWPAAPANIGAFQTKPDDVVACVRLPGRGNNLFVMGRTVTELWVNVGYRLFPYQKTTAFNIDYGCLNSATIATGDTFVIWLGGNEESGATIMYSTGSDIKQISNDGINFRLGQLAHPEQSYGDLIKHDGHLFYILTFYSSEDNLSLVYDFNTGHFFTLTDHKMDHHIAKKIAFFNNFYYFVSDEDGYLYKLDSDITTYNGEEIPRIRITNTIRSSDAQPFIANSLTFVTEQGITPEDEPQAIDVALSRDGATVFGSYVRTYMNPLGHRQNKYEVRRLGRANELTCQFRFWGKERFIAQDGIVRIYQ